MTFGAILKKKTFVETALATILKFGLLFIPTSGPNVYLAELYSATKLTPMRDV